MGTRFMYVSLGSRINHLPKGPKACWARRVARTVSESSLLSKPDYFPGSAVTAKYARNAALQDGERPHSSSSLKSSSRDTCLSVIEASSSRKSTTFSSKIGARKDAKAPGLLR